MTTEDDLLGLVEAHSSTLGNLHASAVEALSAPVRGFKGWYDHSAITRLVRGLEGILGAYEGTAARLTDTYMANAVSIGTGKRFQPVGTRKTHLGRFGVDNGSVLGRITNSYRFQQAQWDKAFIQQGKDGTPFDLVSPADAASERLDRIVGTNLQMAQRAQSQVTMIGAGGRVQGWRRIIHPELAHEGTCGLCIAASDREYHHGELMPIHPGCHCTELPITKKFDPAVLNEIDFRTLYKDAREFGKGTSAEALRQTRYKIDEHGEIGPVIRPIDEPIRKAAGPFGRPGKTEELTTRILEQRSELDKLMADVNSGKKDADTWTPVANRISARIAKDEAALAKIDPNAARKARQKAELARRHAEYAKAPKPKPVPQVVEKRPVEKLVARRTELADAFQKLEHDFGDPEQMLLAQHRIDQLDADIDVALNEEHLFPQILTEHRSIADDAALSNPHYADDQRFRLNCTHCVTAFELRRRGYRVQAAPIPHGLDGRESDSLLLDWITSDGVRRKMTPMRWKNLNNAVGTYPDGARGWVSVAWDLGGAHIFAWERKGGQTVWLDPQRGITLGQLRDDPSTGEMSEIEKYFYRSRQIGMVRLVRTDDLRPTDRLYRYVDPTNDRLPWDTTLGQEQSDRANVRAAMVEETGDL